MNSGFCNANNRTDDNKAIKLPVVPRGTDGWLLLSGFQALVTLTLTLDRVIRHTVVHQSSNSIYQISLKSEKNFLWTDRHFRPPLVLLGRLGGVDLKTITKMFKCAVNLMETECLPFKVIVCITNHSWSAIELHHRLQCSRKKPPHSFVRGHRLTIWDIIWILPQGHRSVADRIHFFLQALQETGLEIWDSVATSCTHRTILWTLRHQHIV